MIAFQVKINLRWPLRAWCRLVGHLPQPVMSIHALLGEGFTYCRRCGDGWRHQGWKKCWLERQHRWKDQGKPSVNTATGVPFRQIQHCGRCNHRRVIDCATGVPV